MEAYKNSNSMTEEAAAVSDESSTWTMYFCQNSETENDGVLETDEESSSYDSSSLLSDAASSFVPNRRNLVSGRTGGGCRQGQIFWKKRKSVAGSGFAGDIDLEDTASSPSSSPKVNDVTNDDMAESIRPHKETRITTKDNIEAVGLSLKDAGDFTGLRKKGLCLVPLAMLSDYYYKGLTN